MHPTRQEHLLAKPDNAEMLSIDGYDVRISNPGKLYFSREVQLTKLDIVRYFLAVAGDATTGALRGVVDRPIVLKRFVDGAEKEPFYQKRAPADLPAYMRTVQLSFPSGRTADECVVDNAAALAWIVNLGCMELHPHPVRTANLDHPDELRVDLDPVTGVPFDDVRSVAVEVQRLLAEHGLTAFCKTSGSRGLHINARIEPRWTFTEVRRAALAVAREMERRMPGVATSKWWKEERQGVFLDYNQNAKDRTTAAAYSVRPLPDARVSAPLAWSEVPTCDPAAFTVLTMPARFAAIGDPHTSMNATAGSLQSLLDLAARDEAAGLADAPWPPHFAKGEGEPSRVQPSKARGASKSSSKDFGHQLQEGFGAQRFRRQSAKKSSPTAQDAEGATAESPKLPRTRRSSKPLLIIAQSPERTAVDAALELWKQRHPEAAAQLQPADVLLDRMRGSAYVWYRLRINLEHISEAQRPQQEIIDPDDDPTRKWKQSDEVQ